MKLKLIQRQPETNDVETFTFQPEQPLSFQAGQYLRYTLKHDPADNRGELRYFTIAAAPHEGVVKITTRFAPASSSFKNALKNMQIGDTIEAEGPGGSFTYPNPDQKAVFIAGGIGITPFRAILADLDHRDLNSPITLLYANKTKEIVFKDIFDQLVKKHSNLKVVYVIDQPDPSWKGEVGKIDENFIKKHVPKWDDPDLVYYVSGPEPMVEAFGKMLEGMGIPKERFKQDFFPGYETH